MKRAVFHVVRVVSVLVVILASVSQARAQMVDTTDPCFVRLFGSSTNILTTGSWNNRDHLEQGVILIRSESAAMLKAVTQAKATIATITPAGLEALRSLNRCLPWLRRQLLLIENQMKKLGISSVNLPQDRRQIEREQLMREVRDALDKTQQLLLDLLTGR
jgi:hypothetical protein